MIKYDELKTVLMCIRLAMGEGISFKNQYDEFYSVCCAYGNNLKLNKELLGIVLNMLRELEIDK
jgi:hypothetical protein